MQNYLLVALGGALGSMARFWVNSMVMLRWPGDFPLATLLVNVTGSLLIGFVFAIVQDRQIGGEAVRLFVIVGVLGGFTTFSAFSLETMGLIQSEQWLHAMFNVVLSVFLCVLSAVIGFSAGQFINRVF